MKLCRKLSAPLTIDELIAQAVDVSAALAEGLHCGRDTRQFFPELAVLLESLPLAQGEFAWTICRLANAARYVAGDERHVAAWEIRQLNRRLAMLNHDPAPELLPFRQSTSATCKNDVRHCWRLASA